MEEEFVRIVAESQPGESQEDFSARLSLFWTHMLRSFPDEFELVYAESIEFEKEGDRRTRQYLCGEDVIPCVVNQMRQHAIGFQEVDPDDRWTKYEAVPSEWWQIEH